MRKGKLWARMLGVEGTVVEDVDFDEAEGALVCSVRPKAREKHRCPHCRRRGSKYDDGDGVRRWRALDVGLAQSFIEAEAPRIRCKRHGVVVAAVPWARHGGGFTRDFENQVTWLAVHTSKTAVCQLMHIAWRTVGRILERVADEAERNVDRLANLRRIGIDEVSYRKGHRYMTVVIDHDTGRLVWASLGKDDDALRPFFALLGPERAQQIELVSLDASPAYMNVVPEECPQATICLDPFHVVSWATKALDDVRRSVWNDLRRKGQATIAQALKRSRYALWKNPEDLTDKQDAKLSLIAKVNRPLYRAYLLKEQLREVLKLSPRAAVKLLDHWLAWASRSKLPAFVELARSIRANREGIVAALEHGLSNARVEAINNQLRLLTRLAFGFHSVEPLVALANLKLGGLCPALPTRR